MSKISIKTDFVDGEKLFAQQLNNNFLVIQEGINANEENLQEVIDQAIVELDEELEEITADRGWDWNGGDRVTFFKGTTSQISGKNITNGQLLYNTETGETALDDSGSRIVTGSGNVVTVADEAPTNPATKEWIKPTTVNGVATAEEYFRNSNNDWVKILTEPSGDTLPIGTIAEFSGSTAPTNWLLCNGQSISRTEYAELFAIIGTNYGEGDGSTTFNLPDYDAVSPTGIEPNLDSYSVIKAKQSVGLLGTITTDITDINVNAVPNASTVKSYVDNKNIFSTTETAIGITDEDTIVYRKVIDFTTSNTLNNFVQVQGVSDIGDIEKYSGYILSGTQKFLLPFSAWDAGSGQARSIWFYTDSNGNLYEAHNNQAQSEKACHLVLEYTKRIS